MSENLSVEQLEEKVLTSRDPYNTLGVNRDATEQDIKKAYRKLSLKLHPDRNTSPRAVLAFQQLERAHATLIDPTKRAIFDRHGEKGVEGYEARGEHDMPPFWEIVKSVAFALGKVPTVLEAKKRRQFFSEDPYPMSEAEEKRLRGVDKKMWIVLWLTVAVGIGLCVLDADRRQPDASFARDESTRHIFEHTIAMDSNVSAKEIRFYTRWKTETLGEKRLNTIKDTLALAIAAQCENEVALADGLALRKQDKIRSDDGSTSVANFPSGKARFKFTHRNPRSAVLPWVKSPGAGPAIGVWKEEPFLEEFLTLRRSPQCTRKRSKQSA
jgi:curved DNA-binding protein CbpA